MSNISRKRHIRLRTFPLIFLILLLLTTLSVAGKNEEESSICEFKKMRKDSTKNFYGEKKEKIKGANIEEIREKLRAETIEKVKNQATETTETLLLKVICGGSCSGVKESEPFKGMLENLMREVKLEINCQCGEDKEKKHTCCFAELSRKKVEEIIDEKVGEKKKKIENEYKAYIDEFSRMMLGNAIKRLFSIYDYLEENFGDILLFSSFLGEEMDLRTIIEQEVGKISMDTIIEAEQSRILFGGDGLVDGVPRVIVNYEDNGKRYPVAKMPISISFIEGEGMIEPKAETLKTGVANIKIYKVEPRYKRAVVRAEVDLSGFKTGNKARFNYVDIEFIKRPTAGFFIKFRNNGRDMRLSTLERRVIELIREKKFDVQKMNISVFSSEDLHSLYEVGIEYFIFLELAASGGRVEGHDLYYSYASGEYSIYETRTRQMVYSGSFPQSKGFGLNTQEAGLKAISDLSTAIINNLKREMPPASEIE